MTILHKVFGKRNTAEYKTADIYRELRQKVLTLDPAAIGFKPAGANQLWGILMETGFPEAVSTLVALADGTVSLYFSNGGGIIGIGQHEGPRKACEAFLALAPKFLANARPTTDFPLPREGQTIFYFLHMGGGYAAEAQEEELGKGGLPLSPLFFKAHDLITQARLADEKMRGHRAGSGNHLPPDAFQVFMFGVTNGDTDGVKKMLAMGIDPNRADPTGLTPLMAAAYQGKENTLRLLLDAGASCTMEDASGYTALMFAANAGALACARILIERGSDVHKGDKDGSTPIMFAAQHGHNEVVRLLLSNGADPARTGKHGLSAIGFAEQNGLHETVNILKRKN